MLDRIRLILFAFLLALFGRISPGQTTYATITGTVTDASGAIIPEVTVTATHVATNLSTTSRSNASGVYTLGQLRDGEYTVRASAAGFKEFVAAKMVLEARDYRRLDIKLEVGDIVQKMEVTAGATLIETETFRISDTRTARQLRTLPMNTTSVHQFLSLTPGITPAAGGSSASFFGTRAGQSWYTTDGTSNDGTAPQLYSLEWFQELKVDAANPSAEYGAPGHVTIISKSGANDLHGSAFEYYSSPLFRARDSFALQRGGSVNHRVGGSLSGPIYIPKVYDGRNRTFFFTSYDTPKRSRNTTNLQPSVPLEAWRRGDFSALGIQIQNPFTGEVYRDGRIPESLINPVAKKIQDRFYPRPNYGDTSKFSAGNYRQTITFPYSGQEIWTSRVDRKIGDKDYVFARYTLSNEGNNSWEGGLPAFGPMSYFRRTNSLTLSYTHTFSPMWLNEARFGHAFLNTPRSGPLKGLEEINYLGITGLAPDLPDIGGLFRISFSGLGVTGLTQTNWTNPGFSRKVRQFQEHVSHFTGTHSIKFGFELRRTLFAQKPAGANLFGAATFANTYTKVSGVAASGHAYADFLFGVPTQASRDFPPTLNTWQTWAYDFFLHDNWKATQRLTVNYGLRYERHPFGASALNTLALFDTASGKIAVPDAGLDMVSPLMPVGYVDVVRASSLGLDPNSVVLSDKNNFAPRAGFAYKLFAGSNKTVLRGGYGIYYDPDPPQISGGNGPPFKITEPGFTNTLPAPSLVLPQAFPASSTGKPTTIALPDATNPHLRTPYTMQWNVTLEHEFRQTGFRLSYVATLGRQLTYRRDMNAPVIDDRLFVDKPRLFPRYPAIMYQDNGGTHNYNGLSFEAQHKMHNGLFFQAGYTWARDVGDAVPSGTIENPFDRRRERGVYESVPNQRLTILSIYELPIGHGKKLLDGCPRLLDLVAGGRQISTVGVFQTGYHLTPRVSIPDPTGTSYTTGRNRPLASIRPDQLRDARLDSPTIDRWFDLDAFAAPPIGRFGNSANGVIPGPGTNVWHLGIHKYFRFSDHLRAPRLRVEVTATNAFNHPNWGSPDTTLTNATTAGTIRSVGGTGYSQFGESSGARSMLGGLRVEW